MDFGDIVTNIQKYKDDHQKRGRDVNQIDELSQLYQNRIRLEFSMNMAKRLRNLISHEIATLAKQKKLLSKQKDLTKDDIDDKVNQNRILELSDELLDSIKINIQTKETFPIATKCISQLPMSQLTILSTVIKELLTLQTNEHKKIKEELEIRVVKLGNLLHPSVPKGKDLVLENYVGYQSDVQVEKLLGHYELCQKLKIVNFKDGVNVMGNRGYFLTGFGVKLNRALISYALDFLEKYNYELIETPHMMTTKAFEGVAQLEDFEETLYQCEDKHLIATAEQPLTALFRDKVLRYKDMPVKLGGISHCYRKEAGAHGKDTLGIFRVHQFEKVEQFCVTDVDNSWKLMDEMLKVAKEFYQSLGIGYRVINIDSTDLNNSAAMKYDLEGYFPAAEKKYKELVSCTNCTDYIARRVHIKNDKNEYVHMLNATLCANTRTICCLLETYQTETGVIIPDVLQPYMGNVKFIQFA